jgi:hypothetical protein
VEYQEEPFKFLKRNITTARFEKSITLGKNREKQTFEHFAAPRVPPPRNHH